MYNAYDEEQNVYTFEVKKFMTVLCYEHLQVDIWFILARKMKLEMMCQTALHCFG